MFFVFFFVAVEPVDGELRGLLELGRASHPAMPAPRSPASPAAGCPRRRDHGAGAESHVALALDRRPAAASEGGVVGWDPGSPSELRRRHGRVVVPKGFVERELILGREPVLAPQLPRRMRAQWVATASRRKLDASASSAGGSCRKRVTDNPVTSAKGWCGEMRRAHIGASGVGLLCMVLDRRAAHRWNGGREQHAGMRHQWSRRQSALRCQDDDTSSGHMHHNTWSIFGERVCVCVCGGGLSV